MKILIASSEFPPGPGGIGTHAYELAKQFTSFGHEVVVVCRQDYSTQEEYKQFNAEQPFEVIRLTSQGRYIQKSTRQIQAVQKHITDIAPDIVIASGAKIVWSVAAASITNTFKWIAVGHGTEFGVSGWQFQLTRMGFQRANGVVCVSNFTRDYMLKQNIRPKHVEVIPNGANESVFVRMNEGTRNTYRASLGLNDRTHVLVTVGNVTPRKGQEIVIRALPHVVKEHPNIMYLMAGLPTNRDILTELAEELGVAQNIHFLGRISQAELVKLLNSADVFIMTSRHTETGDFEGYGIAVVEGALCGLPAIVSDGSGLSEAIVDGETGLEVRMDDPEDTAQAIVRLAKDDDLRKTMGTRAEERAHGEQTWEQRVRRYESFVHDILATS